MHRFMIALLLLLTASPAAAQTFRPGNPVVDGNPSPVKTMCFNSSTSAFEACSSTPLLAVSTTTEAGRTAKTTAGVLHRVTVTTAGSSGYLMVFDATARPGDGVVQPRVCRAVAANTSLDVVFPLAVPFGTGIAAAFSTTGCTTLTASATAFFELHYR